MRRRETMRPATRTSRRPASSSLADDWEWALESPGGGGACGCTKIREEMDQTQAAESGRAFSGAAQTGRGAQIANGKYPFRCRWASIAANAGIEQGTMIE